MRQDHTLRAINHRRVDFYPTVNRPWVHHDGIGFGKRKLFIRQAKAFEVLLTAWQQRARHTLVLQAQHDDDICPLDAFFKRIADSHTHLRHVCRDDGLGANHAYLGAA